MMFDFYKLHTVTDLGGAFFGSPPVTQLVIGVLPLRVTTESGKILDGFEYKSLSEREHRIVGTILRTEDGLAEVHDLERSGEGGAPVIWQINRLTFQGWQDLGRSGQVVGYEPYLRETLTDEFMLGMFYSMEFLQDSSWERHARDRGLIA